MTLEQIIQLVEYGSPCDYTVEQLKEYKNTVSKEVLRISQLPRPLFDIHAKELCLLLAIEANLVEEIDRRNPFLQSWH